MLRQQLTLGFLTAGISNPLIADDFKIIDVKPADGAVDVDREPLIQLHTSDKFDPSTLKDSSVRLLDAQGKPVEKVVTGDLEGVITLAIERPLEKRHEYTIQVTTAVRDV